MKLINLFLILIMGVLTINSALAAPFPTIIYGTLTDDAYPLYNAKITVSNLNNGIVAEASTNSKGVYLVDWSNFDPNARVGDSLKVTLSYCAGIETCSKTVILKDGGTEITFDINAIKQEIPVPETVTIVKYVCWDGTPVDDASKCPIKAVEVVKTVIENFVCLDGTTVESADECPESDNNWIIWIVGILLALLGGAGGWKFYNKVLTHYHKGIKEYHNANTLHINPKYRHTKFWSNPLKCISDVKKIQKGIDLSE